MRISNEHGFSELNEFPRNSQIVISNSAYVYPEHRGKGKGKFNQQLRIRRAKSLGYDYIMSTVIASNSIQLAIMTSEGWKERDRFLNRVTGNTVIIFGKNLNK